MVIEIGQFRRLMRGSGQEAWNGILEDVQRIFFAPINQEHFVGEIRNRDRYAGEIDYVLATSGWDLWSNFGTAVPRTSQVLCDWWQQPFTGRAVLILDGLSLRETPWLLQGAEQRGFQVKQAKITAAELPAETNQFAAALGLGSRSQLQNNQAGLMHKLAPATTESLEWPWLDCAGLIKADPDWLFWHHWPDCKIHAADGPGQGLDDLAQDAKQQLGSDEFWQFIDRLATGRRLVITSDHGYAATGLFHDAAEGQTKYLKETFQGGRYTAGGEPDGFVPPLSYIVDSPHGATRYALGRRKWKIAGGYPTLVHGGLSLLEVLSPFVELSK